MPAIALLLSLASIAPSAAAPDWQAWGSASFQRAKAEDRLIVVHVGTEWCHWCHVMDQETWADAEVLAMLERGFVAVRVDADRRPDVGERYEAWGWPALIFLTPDAQPIKNLKGYRSPEKMREILAGLLKAKASGAGFSVDERKTQAPADLEEARDLARAQLDGYYDDKQAAWGKPKKYPLKAPFVHALYRAARRGEAEWRERALTTLKQQAKITDPVWGGMFQYSTRGDWEHPHTEKLAFMQGWTMSMYAEGYAMTKDEAHLEVARGTFRYVREFLRDPSGAFYANQDADLGTRGGKKMKGPAYYKLDDAERRARGIPWIDKHIYAEHNGNLITGLADLYRVSGDDEVLALATAAYDALSKTHIDGALYKHEGAADVKKRFLVDQVAMGEGMLALFDATGDPVWAERAGALALAARQRFFDDDKGAFLATTAAPDDALPPRVPFQLNARAARLFHRLSLLTDRPALAPLKGDAVRALKFLSKPGWIDRQGRTVGEYLVAVEEVLEEPLHIAVVAKTPGEAGELYAAARALYAPGRVLEFVTAGGRFPDMGAPTAFVCGKSFCSRPLTDKAALAKTVAAFLPLK